MCCLKPGTSYKSVEDKIPGMVEKYVGPQVQKVLGIDLKAFMETGNQYGIFMQPLSDVHLNPEIDSSF